MQQNEHPIPQIPCKIELLTGVGSTLYNGREYTIKLKQGI